MLYLQVLVERLSGTLAFTRPGGGAAPAMPFIDDDLLWSDNDSDSKIPDLTQCLTNVSAVVILVSYWALIPFLSTL